MTAVATPKNERLEIGSCEGEVWSFMVTLLGECEDREALLRSLASRIHSLFYSKAFHVIRPIVYLAHIDLKIRSEIPCGESL
jgi:hypothetical protein